MSKKSIKHQKKLEGFETEKKRLTRVSAGRMNFVKKFRASARTGPINVLGMAQPSSNIFKFLLRLQSVFFKAKKIQPPKFTSSFRSTFYNSPSDFHFHIHRSSQLLQVIIVFYNNQHLPTMAVCSTSTRFYLPLPSNPSNPNSDSRKIRHSRRADDFTCSSSSITTQSQYSAKENLFSLIADQDRGLKTQKDSTRRSSIIEAIDALAELGRDTVTTTAESLSATWRLLWTTEKEQLFIIEKAYLFGTQTGDVLQVIDVEKKSLNNVITFPPDGVFFVRSDIEIASAQRVNFR